ncbi:MAG: pyridoxamine 5'-phosphate oxidase [Bacteroidetes bacterium]|nr:pyridoxamine 5'-phosphate oxidase [Bacteroidota bacterium]
MPHPILHNIRKDYQRERLLENNVNSDPFLQFRHWLNQAIEAGIDEPTAMMLSTVDVNGNPSSRIVLLKDATNKGLTFFTNYESRKGEEMLHHPKVAALFFWSALERQVRIEGFAEKIDSTLSDDYFTSRPVDSRFAAHASPQSKVITGRDILESELEAVKKRYADIDIPRPAHWGGYQIIPNYFEFWQGGAARLHDRLRYTKQSSDWKIERLAP